MVNLYSTGCPNCKVLKMKLDKKNIQYELCEDVEKMKELGFKSAPYLEADGMFMPFAEAIKWVNAQ